METTEKFYRYNYLDELSGFVVHATNPNNVISILSNGYLYSNNHFSSKKIDALRAFPYPDEDNRYEDNRIYFSEPHSIIPEVAVNYHEKLKDVDYLVAACGHSFFMEIIPVRFFYEKDKIKNLMQGNKKEFFINDEFDIRNGIITVIGHKSHGLKELFDSYKFPFIEIEGDFIGEASMFVERTCEELLKIKNLI